MARAPSRLSRLLPGRLAGEVAARARRGRLGVLARLLRLDPPLARAWLRAEDAVARELGRTEARALTGIVERLALGDAGNAGQARLVAHTLPDQLARVPPERRPAFLGLLARVADDRPSAVPLLLRTLPDLVARMDDEAVAGHVARALEIHERAPTRAESFLKLESREGQEAVQEREQGVRLVDVQRRLTLYARAHCGETVQVRPAPEGGAAFTDGRTIYLPERVDRFGDERDALVYRVLTARNAGHVEFGSLDLDVAALPGEFPPPEEGETGLERFLRAFPNRVLARDLYRVLENARVEARVREEYPGVARDMDRLAGGWRPELPDPAALAPAEQAVALLAAAARGEDVAALAGRLTDAAARGVGLEALPWLDRVRAPGATALDTARAVQALYPAVDGLLRRVDPDALERLDDPARRAAEDAGDARRDGVPTRGAAGGGQAGRESGEGDGYRPLDGDLLEGDLRPEAMGEEGRKVEARARELLEAMRRHDPEASLSEARERARREGSSYEEMADFLDRMPAPAAPAAEEAAAESDRVPVGTRGGEESPIAAGVEAVLGVHVYPEWDCRIDDHKPRWVKLTEYRLEPGSQAFVEEVLAEHGPLIARLRRAFEALRPQSVQRVRGVPDGDEIDIDRAVMARVERRVGGVPDDRLYVRHQRDDRDVAVAFLLDMSSSTNEVVGLGTRRIIDVEKESLVLIAEAVQAIGDAFAIYGFSGYGRDQVAFYVAKDFGEPWNDEARARVGRIAWKMENRDGTAIRHATHKLLAWPAKVRLLLLLSDGKPLDCGCDLYADTYAQEDTRAALVEARAAGVHPFCITVDPRGQEYLSRMYGEVGYTIIDRVEALPERLPQIYRRLTR